MQALDPGEIDGIEDIAAVGGEARQGARVDRQGRETASNAKSLVPQGIVEEQLVVAVAATDTVSTGV